MEKDPIEAAVETGGSAAAGPEKSPAAEPSVVVDAGSPSLPSAAQAIVFVVLDSLAVASVLSNDAAMSTGDVDEETESDSIGEEVDHSSVATGIGKNP